MVYEKLILHPLWASFSSDTVESPSWSCILSQSKHDQPLDVRLPQVTKLVAAYWMPRFGGLLHGELVSLHMHRGYGRVCPWTMVGVVGCGFGRVCLWRRWLVSSGKGVPGSPRELMLISGTKLPWEGRSVADSIWGTFTVFSSDTVESPSWSWMLSQSKHDHPLNGWLQHVTVYTWTLFS